MAVSLSIGSNGYAAKDSGGAVNVYAYRADRIASINQELRVVANGFLPQMVRNIVGAVIQVGTGRHEPEWIDELIAANDRRVLGDAAPPQGLALWRVRYDDVDERHDAQFAGRMPGEGYGEE